jgi:hypothetical protein
MAERHVDIMPDEKELLPAAEPPFFGDQWQAS